MSTYQNNIQCARRYEKTVATKTATELKPQEEETRLRAQTFIPSALSRCNYIRQKYEKYATHSQKNSYKFKQIQKICRELTDAKT